MSAGDEMGHPTSGGLALWLPGAAYSAGLALILSGFFWGGFFLMTVSLPVFCFLYTYSYSQISNKTTPILVMISFALMYAYVLFIIWTPNSLSTSIMDVGGNFAEGDDIYGIKWRSYYYLMLISLHNGPYDVGNVTAFIRSDDQILAVNLDKNSNACSAVPVGDPIQPVITMVVEDGAKNIHKGVADKVESSQLYQVHCEGILPGTSVIVALAVAEKPHAKAIRRPKWLEVSASGETGRVVRRPFTLLPEMKCFSPDDNDCKVPLMPNDYVCSTMYIFWQSIGYHDDVNCLSPRSDYDWVVYYAHAPSVSGQPSHQPLGSPQ